MAKKINIGFLIFGESETSFAFSLLFQTIEQEYEIETVFINESTKAIPSVDILMVSIVCAADIFAFLNFCHNTGIKENCGIPVVIGGSMVNPELLHGFYDYCVLGDGEIVINDLISVILSDKKTEIDGVVTPKTFKEGNIYRTNKIVPPILHSDKRRISVPRIEIARGCKWKCPFCHIAAIKPYRELDKNIIINMCRQVKGRQVGLFAPDRADHSGFEDIVSALSKMGKSDSSSDMRLDSTEKHDIFSSQVRIGFEGFSDLSRTAHRKCGGIDNVKRQMNHLLNVVKNKKGKNISMLNMYMILDLPTERDFDPFPEFENLMNNIFNNLDRKFTLFVIGNSFCPMPFTKYENESIDIYSDHGKKFKNIKIQKNNKMFSLAIRGGMKSPVNRIMTNVAIRGDESLSNISMAMATKMKKFMNSYDPIVISKLKKGIEKSNFKYTDIVGNSDYLWWKKHKIEKINK